MDVLREREVKDSLERQLQDEQKVRGEYKSIRFYLVKIARGMSFYEASNRDDLSEFTSGTQPAPHPPYVRTALRKLTWPANNASTEAESARSATHGNLTGVHRAPRAGFRSRSLTRR